MSEVTPETMPAQPTDLPQAMTPPQPPVDRFVGDEAAFCRTLGIDPIMVKAGSIRIEWQNAVPRVEFIAVQPVTPQALGLAFLASAPAEPQNVQESSPQLPDGLPDGSQGPVAPPAAPQDHQPKAGKRTAAKKTAKKAS